MDKKAIAPDLWMMTARQLAESAAAEIVKRSSRIVGKGPFTYDRRIDLYREMVVKDPIMKMDAKVRVRVRFTVETPPYSES